MKTKVIPIYDKGGNIADTCYVNYEGYQVQNIRCKDEGVDFILTNEYREVAKDLRRDYPSEWIYYNRMSRLSIDEEDAFDFVEQSNNHFNPAAKVHPFFLDVDRSFASYLSSGVPADRKINVSLSTEKPPIYDKVKLKQFKEKQKQKGEQELPIARADEFVFENGRYWWIGMVVNIGKGYELERWKPRITNKNVPVDNGISLATLIHEYAHCLDYNYSIMENRIYEIPYGEIEKSADFIIESADFSITLII